MLTGGGAPAPRSSSEWCAVLAAGLKGARLGHPSQPQSLTREHQGPQELDLGVCSKVRKEALL